MTIKLYDNSIDLSAVNLIEQTLYSPRTSWNIPSGGFTTTYDPNLEEKIRINPQIVDASQFTHQICSNGIIHSNLYPLISAVISNWFGNHFPIEDEQKKINYQISFLRIKSNMMILQKVQSENNIFYNIPHVDPIDKSKISNKGHMIVFLYYVSDSDGDTFFFDDKLGLNIKERVSPKKGRAVLFDGYHIHASSPPQKHKSRCVINANILSPFSVTQMKD